MQAIARCYDRRPLFGLAQFHHEGKVYILKPSAVNSFGNTETVGVGYPEHEVFEFDLALYAALLTAWTRGDSLGLIRLWESAKPLYATTTPCAFASIHTKKSTLAR